MRPLDLVVVPSQAPARKSIFITLRRALGLRSQHIKFLVTVETYDRRALVFPNLTDQKCLIVPMSLASVKFSLHAVALRSSYSGSSSSFTYS